ncbi:hypothetical protein F2Q70_00027781 [Brassica cretica]|uniref:Uncharacterized protein n=1 Tax=Brassica cretica TaxID=69181 RepID=A0A8S9IAZ7_BRACR|nr:hypothetical protein F2Q68_00027330 [Brassica cretica]KAF2601534.1 hypothetical protein F2Q70_00027781 [Brassica cretica]
MSSFQGSIESWFSGNFQALIPSWPVLTPKWVNGGWRVLLSIVEERLPLRIGRSKLAVSDENSSGVSLLLLVLLGMHLKRQEKFDVRKLS